MLGSFRFFLALCVVVFHLSGGMLGEVRNLGQFAVECFYVISGFLITMILVETYKFDFRSFATNRALRLYPSYYAFAIAALAMWLTLPRMDEFHPCWVWAGRVTDVIGNLLIWPWTLFPDAPNNFKFRLIPSTWSIAVEICCYFLLWAFAARSLKLSVLALLASAAYHVYAVFNIPDSAARYYPVSAAMLAFSAGSIAYRFSAKLTALRPTWMTQQKNFPVMLIAAVALFLCTWSASTYDRSATSNPFYYGVIIVAAVVVLAFHGLRAGGALGKVDRWLGDLSYPVFLIHYPAGYVAWLALGQPTEIRSWTIALMAIPISMAASWLVVRLVDIPLRKTRDSVRSEAIAATRMEGQTAS